MLAALNSRVNKIYCDAQVLALMQLRLFSHPHPEVVLVQMG